MSSCYHLVMMARFSKRGLALLACGGLAVLLGRVAPSQAEMVADMPAPMPPKPPPQPTAYKIVGMTAFLFLRESGTWHSQDLFTATGLWNTTIGEGLAGEPSSTASLLVRLQGETFNNVTGKLDVVVMQNKRKLLGQTSKLQDLFTTGKNVTAAFFVQGIGCGDVVVTATLRVPAKPVATVTQRIKFECGE